MLPGIRASQRQFAANTTLWPSNAFHRICVVLAGSFASSRDSQAPDFSRGAVVFRPAGERGPIRFGAAGMRSLTIEISAEAGEALFKAGILPNQQLALRCPECLRLAFRIATEISSPVPSSALVSSGFLLEIIGYVSRAVPNQACAKPLWLRAVVRRLRSEFRNPGCISDYAASAGVHPVTLAKAFREHERLTMGDFIRQLRLQHAAELLIKSPADITDIALESGFADHSHLSRWFRRCFGMTPSTYRRVHRG